MQPAQTMRRSFCEKMMGVNLYEQQKVECNWGICHRSIGGGISPLFSSDTFRNVFSFINEKPVDNEQFEKIRKAQHITLDQALKPRDYSNYNASSDDWKGIPRNLLTWIRGKDQIEIGQSVRRPAQTEYYQKLGFDPDKETTISESRIRDKTIPSLQGTLTTAYAKQLSIGRTVLPIGRTMLLGVIAPVVAVVAWKALNAFICSATGVTISTTSGFEILGC